MTTNTNGKRWPDSAGSEADYIEVETNGPGALAAALLRAHNIPHREKLRGGHGALIVTVNMDGEAVARRLTFNRVIDRESDFDRLRASYYETDGKPTGKPTVTAVAIDAHMRKLHADLDALRKAKAANEEQARITLEETRAELYETTRQNGDARALLWKARAVVGASEEGLLARLEHLVKCEQTKTESPWQGLVVDATDIPVPGLKVDGVDLERNEVSGVARINEALYHKLRILKPGTTVTVLAGGAPIVCVMSRVTLEQITGEWGRFTFTAALKR